MKYMGSKSRIANEILPIILKDRKDGQYYVEPFCGGCNAMDKVSGNRIGNDNNQYLIEMFKAICAGWVPPLTVSNEEYHHVKNHRDDNKALTGFVGICCSFGAKWFGGYARGKDSHGGLRNYADESRRYLLKQAPLLDGVIFYSGSYDTFPIPPDSIIYCDPPYLGTTGYSSEPFDYPKFWQWRRDMTNRGHKVFISEYEAPSDFNCVWAKEITNSLNQSVTYKPTERLFVYGG